MANQNIDIRTAAVDAVRGFSSKGNYNEAQLSEFIREEIRKACGGEWNYYAFEDNKMKVFAILADIMPASINASLAGQFEGFADFKDTAMGDLNYFHVDDDQLFKVYTTARGTTDIERQTLNNRAFSVPTYNKSIKVYAELEMLMAGKIDFGRMVQRVAMSFAHEIGYMISNAIYGSYASVGTNFKATGAFDDDTLDDIIANVKAASGKQSVQIFGTEKALKQVSNAFGYADEEIMQANSIGYYASYAGNPMIKLPEAYLAGTQTFAVNRNHIIVLPAGEKIVKFVFEGQPLVMSGNPMDRNDLQQEYLWSRRMGAAAIVVQEGKYGFYKFS